MNWVMRDEYKIAYEKAEEVLKNINYSSDEMMRTASIIKAVEEIEKIDVKFDEYNFSELESKKKDVDFSNFGAAMCISEINGVRTANILLNSKETDSMKRFSLVHELGHLMTGKITKTEGYQVSTHIDMDITSIPEDILDKNEFKFLIDEQIANIFALLVLIPVELLKHIADKKMKLSEAALFLGVEENALVSRIQLYKINK